MKAEFASRYGEGLTDEEIRAAARAEMLSRAEEQLKVSGMRGVCVCDECLVLLFLFFVV